MTDPIEAAEQRRQQIATAVERLEAAANEWRKIRYLPTIQNLYATWVVAFDELTAAIDELARLRGEG